MVQTAERRRRRLRNLRRRRRRSWSSYCCNNLSNHTWSIRWRFRLRPPIPTAVATAAAPDGHKRRQRVTGRRRISTNTIASSSGRGGRRRRFHSRSPTNRQQRNYAQNEQQQVAYGRGGRRRRRRRRPRLRPVAIFVQIHTIPHLRVSVPPRSTTINRSNSSPRTRPFAAPSSRCCIAIHVVALWIDPCYQSHQIHPPSSAITPGNNNNDDNNNGLVLHPFFLSLSYPVKFLSSPSSSPVSLLCPLDTNATRLVGSIVSFVADCCETQCRKKYISNRSVAM